LASPTITKQSFSGQDFSKATEFGDLGISREAVTSRLVWIPQKTFQKVQLAWEVNIAPKKSADSWRVIVDAKSGNVVKKENYTIYDNWRESKAVRKKPQAEGLTLGNTQSSPSEFIARWKRTGGSEPSQYPQEEKTRVIPSVAASERGRAQTDQV